MINKRYKQVQEPDISVDCKCSEFNKIWSCSLATANN